MQCAELDDFLRSLSSLEKMSPWNKKKKKKGEWEKRKESEEAGVMKSQLANAPEDKVRLLEVAVEYF